MGLHKSSQAHFFVEFASSPPRFFSKPSQHHANSMLGIGACGLFAALGTGVGGNLPVDGALFLEFLPTASGRHLTLLSVWWPVGQLVA